MAVNRTVLVASFVAAFLVAGTAVAVLVSRDGSTLSSRSDDQDEACGGPLFSLRRLEAAVEDTGADGGDHRTVTYTLQPDGLEGGAIRLCTGVGEVTFAPSGDDLVTLTFTIRASDDGSEADVRDAKVDAVFASDDGGLRVVGWHDADDRRDEHVSVDVEITLPESGAWDLEGSTGVGDILVNGLLVGGLDLSTGVGDVVADAEATRDVTASTGVGDVVLDLSSVGAGRIDVSTGVGGVSIELPLRADVGYDATVQTGVGEVELDIGPTESKASDKSPVGGTAKARSDGYADKPTKVVVSATAGTGDASVHAE
ncbi:MAG TPA: hypothetical protein VI997_08850 [Candidatus Thermoplasmatota archaeon]|nr:hypothetical protein [Candidatus Thermoplasmatota archaeon]